MPLPYIKQNTYLKENFLSFWPVSSSRLVSSVFIFSEAPSREPGATACTCKDIWAFGHPTTQTGNCAAHCGWVCLLNCHTNEAGKTALQLRAHTALAEDPSSVPGTNIKQLTTTWNPSSRVLNTLFWPHAYLN